MVIGALDFEQHTAKGYLCLRRAITKKNVRMCVRVCVTRKKKSKEKENEGFRAGVDTIWGTRNEDGRCCGFEVESFPDQKPRMAIVAKQTLAPRT